MDEYQLLPDDNRAFGPLPDLSMYALKCRGCSFTATAGSAGLQLAIMHERNPPSTCVGNYDPECAGWEFI